MFKKILLGLSAVLLLAIGAAAYVYFRVLSPAVLPAGAETVYVAFPTGSSYEQIEQQLQAANLIPNVATFRMLATRLGYKRDNMRTGRFAITPGMTMLGMIRDLRNGRQAPVNVVLTTEREPENVAAKAARFIEPDSLAIVALMRDTVYLDSIGYTPQTLMTLFIPNSYEFFWNTSPRGFIERMIKEHDLFWSKNQRRDKAKALGLTPEQVYTLASIVEKETLQNDEKPRMAGVYYNRFKIDMPLQADPTAVFATRDFTTKRVTTYHTGIDSPYNTYKYTGLPPGPIAMSSITSIDAVLNLESHDYLYFCARGDGTSYHNFAKTLPAHNQNAAIYRENLRKRGLR